MLVCIFSEIEILWIGLAYDVNSIRQGEAFCQVGHTHALLIGCVEVTSQENIFLLRKVSEDKCEKKYLRNI